MAWHLAETREEARAQAKEGLFRWHNEYNVGTLMRPGAAPFATPEEGVMQTSAADGAASVIGTPDDLVAAIRRLMELSGGFGTVIGFAHDWANRENTARSWDLVARHVIPEINGHLEGYRASRQYVIEHRESFERAGAAGDAEDHGQRARRRGAAGDARRRHRHARRSRSGPAEGEG